MEFRPCIDIHNGKVKQIVGSTLKDEGDQATENFVSDKNADYYAGLYKEKQLPGGHVILLNARDSQYYEETKAQAMMALGAYPGGLMVGGGITDENAQEFLDAGASHVIVTSYVFRDGEINMDNLSRLVKKVGRKRVVLDLSCRRQGEDYYIVTDRWQKFTKVRLSADIFNELADYCDEFLVHAVDTEGKASGIDEKVLAVLSKINHTITYAGGISSLEDIRKLKELGKDRVHFTVGSKLDLFGGNLSLEGVIECTQ